MDVVGHDSQVIKRNRGLDADASRVPIVVRYYGGGGRSFICSRSLLKKELVEYIKKSIKKKSTDCTVGLKTQMSSADPSVEPHPSSLRCREVVVKKHQGTQDGNVSESRVPCSSSSGYYGRGGHSFICSRSLVKRNYQSKIKIKKRNIRWGWRPLRLQPIC